MQYYFDLVMVLTHKDLKTRYKSSVLGYFWSVANPLAFAIVFYIAFKVIMKIDMENYALFLIMGLFPWQWLNNSVGLSTSVFLSNANMLKKVSFPRNVLPLAIVLQDMVNYLFSIPVIVLFMLLDHHPSYWSWLYGIPVMLILQLVLTYGICLIVSSINLFFRDLERLVGIALLFCFYFTPIIYPVSMIPEHYRHWLYFNPFAPLIINWRELFMHGRLDGFQIILGIGYSGLAMLAGVLIYRKLSDKFAEVL